MKEPSKLDVSKCALSECENIIVQGRLHGSLKRYCCDTHRATAASRRARKRNPDANNLASRKWRSKPKNKQRHAVWVKRWATSNAEHVRERRRQRKYGVPFGWYADKLREQNNVDPITLRTESNRRLAIDHNHLTKQVRGLLTTNSNRALGLLEVDDPNNARRLVRYLLRYCCNGGTK